MYFVFIIGNYVATYIIYPSLSAAKTNMNNNNHKTGDIFVIEKKKKKRQMKLVGIIIVCE